MKFLKFVVSGIGGSLLLIGLFVLADVSWHRSQARKVLDPAIERLAAAAPINDMQAMSAACNREDWAKFGKVECKLGNYPILYRGHRINFTEIHVLYYSDVFDKIPHRAVVRLDKNRRPHLVGYRSALEA